MAVGDYAWGGGRWGGYAWGGGSPAVIVPPIEISGLPGLMANDRYQLLVLSEKGTDGVVPQFRYWLAAPPEWGSVLPSADHDALVRFFATDESGVPVDGNLETTYVDVSPASMGLAHAVVEFVPRPWLLGSFDGGLNPGDLIGFELVVEATGVRDLRMATGVGAFVTGVHESETISCYLTAEEIDSENWPNAITVTLPVRMDLDAHQARLSFRAINHCEISWAELYGVPKTAREN